MADNEGQKPSKRTETEQTARRRRGGAKASNSALAVPESVKKDLAKNGLEGRWINDIGNRMHQKTELDDWDKVSEVKPVPVGVDQRTGKPIMAHYCAKPTKFMEADNRERMNKIAAQEQAVFSGRDNVEVEGAYNPNDLNSIKREALSKG